MCLKTLRTIRMNLRHLRGIGHKLCGSGRHACRTLGGSVALGFKGSKAETMLKL